MIPYTRWLAISAGLLALLIMAAAFAIAPGYTQPLNTPEAPSGVGVFGPGDLEATREVATAFVTMTQQARRENLASTSEALRLELQQTATAESVDFEATTQAIGENVSGTATIVRGSADATATAISANLQATAEAAIPTREVVIETRADAIAATAGAVATTLAQPDDVVRATVVAAATQTGGNLGGLAPDQVEAALTMLGEYGSIAFNEETGTVDVVANISEELFNAALDAAFTVGGYDPSAVAADIIPEGIFITAEDVTLTDSLSGRLTMLVEVSAADGRLAVVVVFAALDDQPLPNLLVDQLNAQISAAATVALTGTGGYAYIVQDAFTTETHLVITLQVPVEAPAG